jgi:hypothetical protein
MHDTVPQDVSDDGRVGDCCFDRNGRDTALRVPLPGRHAQTVLLRRTGAAIVLLLQRHRLLFAQQ